MSAGRSDSGASSLASLGIIAAVTAAAALIGSLATGSSMKGWYQKLKKPAFNPPSWVFGPVWTTLYAAMTAAAWLVWRRRGDHTRQSDVRVSTALYGVQLTLNSLWSIIFFGRRAPGAALVEIAALWTAIVAWYTSAIAIDSRTRFLILPYIAWTSFAAVLNAGIWWKNR
jgi:tryptophan-rich sensory protein